MHPVNPPRSQSVVKHQTIQYDEGPSANGHVAAPYKIIMASSRPTASRIQNKRNINLAADGRKSAMRIGRRKSSNKSTIGSVISTTPAKQGKGKVLDEKRRYLQKFDEMNKMTYSYFSTEEKLRAENALVQSERLLDNFRAFWYLNQKALGDMLDDRAAYLAMTKTLNNMGMISKSLGKHNQAC